MSSPADGPVLTPIGRTVGEAPRPDHDEPARVSHRDETPAQGIAMVASSVAPAAAPHAPDALAPGDLAPGDTAPPNPLPPRAAEQRLPRDITPPQGTPVVRGERVPVPEYGGTKIRRKPRRARLYLYRLDAWSVMKVAFMLSVAIAIILVTAVAATWWLLDYSGVFATLARNVNEVIGSGTTTFDLLSVIAFDRVMGLTIVIAALEIALVSILAGVFAVLYNLTVGITGGVEVTFSDAV